MEGAELECVLVMSDLPGNGKRNVSDARDFLMDVSLIIFYSYLFLSVQEYTLGGQLAGIRSFLTLCGSHGINLRWSDLATSALRLRELGKGQ